MRRLTIVLLGLGLPLLAVAQLPGPLVLDGQPRVEQSFEVTRHTLYYEDPAIDTLQSLASVRTKRFIPLTMAPQVRSHGENIKSTRIIWLQFQVANTHSSDTLRLWYDPGVHAISSLYDSAGIVIGRAGLFTSRAEPIQFLPLIVPPRSTKLYFVRTIDYVRVLMYDSNRIYTPEGSALARVQEASLTKWLLVTMSMSIGCLLLMGLYILFQYYMNRDTAYLFYALYALAGFCWILKFADPRFALGLTPRTMPQLAHPHVASLSFTVSLFYALFLSKLLDLRHQQPTFWRIIQVLMVLLVIQQAISFIEVWTGPLFVRNTYYLISDASGLVTGLLLIVATIRSRSPLKSFLLVGGISLFLISISPLHGFLFISTISPEAKVFINYPPFFMALGLVIELFCFALALAYRNRLTELENRSLHATYTQQLESELTQRTREIQEQSQQLEKQHIAQLALGFEQKLAETEMTALRAQMNPHFIFNCLNSIKLYAIENDPAKAAEYLTKFSRLIRLVLENSRSERVTLQNELDALRLYLDMEAMRFKDKLSFQISVAEIIDPEFVEIPPLLLQPYVENAIWHGLMHKLEGGRVEVLVEQPQEDQLRITITDDGIGRA
ncbi:MAG TPA: histidine kinase, partial [Fibrella sp.]